MARRAMLAAALVMVLGLAGAGLLPREPARGNRDRAEQVFAAHWQAAASDRIAAQPLAFCPACIQIARARDLDEPGARGYCAAACGIE